MTRQRRSGHQADITREAPLRARPRSKPPFPSSVISSNRPSMQYSTCQSNLISGALYLRLPHDSSNQKYMYVLCVSSPATQKKEVHPRPFVSSRTFFHSHLIPYRLFDPARYFLHFFLVIVIINPKWPTNSNKKE